MVKNESWKLSWNGYLSGQSTQNESCKSTELQRLNRRRDSLEYKQNLHVVARNSTYSLSKII